MEISRKQRIILAAVLALMLLGLIGWLLTAKTCEKSKPKPKAQTGIVQSVQPAPTFVDLPVLSREEEAPSLEPKFNENDNVGLSAYSFSKKVKIVKTDCVLPNGKHIKGTAAIEKGKDPKSYDLIEAQTENGLVRFAKDQTPCTFD